MKRTSISAGKIFNGFGFITALGVLTLVFGLTGCVSPGVASKTIAIESDPSGMRVEVNGEDLGKTPTSYTVKANRKGDFAGSFGDSPSIMFVVFPPEGATGLYKQRKTFTPSAFMDKGDRVPEKIFFDMHLESGR